jgi:hypothetical protein
MDITTVMDTGTAQEAPVEPGVLRGSRPVGAREGGEQRRR